MRKHEIYKVGGAVRDAAMGLVPKDTDYVVIGATPKELLSAGFIQVGASFPVFLHPKTKDEYALARVERKVGKGYKGFETFYGPDVTLEQDLGRRDLTVNAIAVSVKTGDVVDPYGGLKDIENKLLKHVNALSFVEDPVRVLRIARFAAQYQDFTVHPETMELLKAMVAQGMLNDLVAERIWAELKKGLMTDKPSRMFEVLKECGALHVLLPELTALAGVPQRLDHHPEGDTFVHTMLCVDYAAKTYQSLAVRWAVVLHDLGKALTPMEILPAHPGHDAAGVPLVQAVCVRLKVPTKMTELAMTMAQYHIQIHSSQLRTPKSIVKLFNLLDVRRKGEQFESLLQACICDARGRTGRESAQYPQADYLRSLLKVYLNVDDAKAAAGCRNPRNIPQAINSARCLALRNAINETKPQ